MRRSIAVVAVALVIGACGPGDSTSTSLPGETPTTGVDATASSTAAPGSATTTSTATPSTSVSPASTTTTSVTSTTATSPDPVLEDPYFPSAASRSDVPWEDVGAGWYVALYDSSKADPTSGSDIREGPVALYLVDADANRYQVAAWPADNRPWGLVDATATSALVMGNGATIDDTEWQFVDLTTGSISPVYTVGFPDNSATSGPTASLTRPTGANVVVYRSDGTDEWLERRSPDGTVLATVYSQPYVDHENSLRWMYGHDGTSLLVTHHGGIAAVSNTGTTLDELWTPPDTRCDSVRWWNSATFLAACYGRGPASAPVDDYGQPHTAYGRLWLLETDGTAGEPMTVYPSDPVYVGDFGYHDGWPGAADTFIEWSGDCGASHIAVLQPDGTGQALATSVPTTIFADGVAMVDIVDGQMAVFGWQGCAGDVGALFAADLTGSYLHDLVPVVGDARGVIGVEGLATVFP